MVRKPNWNLWLDIADLYAKTMTGCKKVHVGSIIVSDDNRTILGIGANRAFPDLCKCRECLRVEKYGDNDKTHRGPADCRALHSEVDAICNSISSVKGATIFVTRYPCEACARAIVAAGIREVVYGRQQKITEETQRIFDDAGVSVVWFKEWSAPDVEN